MKKILPAIIFFSVLIYFFSVVEERNTLRYENQEYQDQIYELEEIIDEAQSCASDNRYYVEEARGEIEWFFDEGDYWAVEDAQGSLENFSSCEDILDY